MHRHFQKMKPSLGNKRNELSEAHIDRSQKNFIAAFEDGHTCKVVIDDKEEERICSKIFNNR